jgi:hypothetical protein
MRKTLGVATTRPGTFAMIITFVSHVGVLAENLMSSGMRSTVSPSQDGKFVRLGGN